MKQLFVMVRAVGRSLWIGVVHNLHTHWIVMEWHHCRPRHRLGLDEVNDAVTICISRRCRTIGFTVIREAVKVLQMHYPRGQPARIDADRKCVAFNRESGFARCVTSGPPCCSNPQDERRRWHFQCHCQPSRPAMHSICNLLRRATIRFLSSLCAPGVLIDRR